MEMKLTLFFLLISLQSIYSFDMWKIIAQSKKEAENKTGGAAGTILRDTVVVVGERDGDSILYSPPRQNAPTKRNAMFSWHLRLWVTREIPYVITGNLRQTKHTNTILESLKEFSSKTCLKFRPKRYSDEHWIEYYRGIGCYSGIGRKYWKTKTPTRISLGTFCCVKSVVVHETMHALGFFHEQSRPERDSFVKIYTNRVKPGMRDNFIKQDAIAINTEDTPYDLHSIMHYGRENFRINDVKGNTIESKFDPYMDIGNDELSPIDILELNRRYQCDVPSGWGRWSKMSLCRANWRKDCTKASVRICWSKDQSRCPGVNTYGSQDNVVDCPLSQCKVDKQRADAHWSNWSEYSQCSGKCDWGTQIRYRKCNNPVATNGGKNCAGKQIKEKRLCRRKRCSGNKSNDQHFDTPAFGRWTKSGFTTKLSSGWEQGPKVDHTTQIGKRGYYASAKGQAVNYNPNTKTLSSPWILSYQGSKCITFSYMLNGAGLLIPDALSLYVIDSKKRKQYLSFKKGGHISNRWLTANAKISGQTSAFQIVFEAKFQYYRESEIAIDDIFIDHNVCQEGLNACRDIDKQCEIKAKLGHCINPVYMTQMFGDCCATCNNPEFWSIQCNDTKDENRECDVWSKKNECAKNPSWMLKNCCPSCMKNGNFSPEQDFSLIQCTGTKDEHKECDVWSKKNECAKNLKWMLKNFCPSCKKNENFKPEPKLSSKQCTGTKDEHKECDVWSKKKECAKNPKWMLKNCCPSCKKNENFKPEPKLSSKQCTGTKDEHKECDVWSKKNECVKNPKWMLKNCCPSCKKNGNSTS